MMELSERPYLKIPGLLWCLVILLQLRSEGQPLLTRTYDTLLTGAGYGNYHVNFPQWNPDSGMLVSAKVNARVTVHYGFTLRNVDVNSSTYAITMGREDQIISPVLPASYDNTVTREAGSFPLDPGQSVSQGPFIFPDNYNNIDSITGDPVPFTGAGMVNFTYSPFTFANIRTSNNASYYYGTTTVLDTIHFSLTYLYAPGVIALATTLVRFGAVPEDPATVALTWATANEQAGRQYEVQASRDGQTFTPVITLPATLPAVGSLSQAIPGASQPGDPAAGDDIPGASEYAYNYPLPGDRAGKWYFRLKITAASGAVSYSEVRSITATGAPESLEGLSLYPNPATDHVTVAPGPQGGPARDWQIDLLAADGSLILQNHYRQQTGPVRIDFQRNLPSGVYFIRVLDLLGHKWITAPLFVTLPSH